MIEVTKPHLEAFIIGRKRKQKLFLMIIFRDDQRKIIFWYFFHFMLFNTEKFTTEIVT